MIEIQNDQEHGRDRTRDFMENNDPENKPAESTPAPQPPPAAETPAASASAPELSKEAKQFGMLCHVTALAGVLIGGLGNWIGPLVIWLLKKEEFPFVDDQGVGHLLRRAELARGVDLERRSVQVGHVLLDVLPDAAIEIGIARRHAIDADTLGHQLAAQPLGVMDQRGLDRAIGAGGEIDLETRHAGYQHDRRSSRTSPETAPPPRPR